MRKLDITVKGRAGVIVTPEPGDTTGRRLALESERHDPQMTGVIYEFRRPGVGEWQQVPLAQLRLDDGAAPSSYPLTLDAQGKARESHGICPQRQGSTTSTERSRSGRALTVHRSPSNLQTRRAGGA